MKAIIFGAGPAGLTAAYKLLKETDILPIIYEQSPYIGGISQTRNHEGNRLDFGGHRFFTKSKEVMDIWESLLPLQGYASEDDILLGRNREFPGQGDPQKDDDVFLLRNRVSRIYHMNHFFDYPISLKYSTLKNMGFIRTVKAGCGYMKSALVKRKENNLEDFYINRFGKPLYKMFFEDYTAKLWGRHPSEISAEWGAQRVKGLSLSKALLNALKKPFRKDTEKIETSLIENYYYPKFGPGQIYEKMAKEIVEMGGKIIVNAKVSGINLLDGKIADVTIEQDNKTFTEKADYYISSIPIKDLIEGMNDVPSEIQEIAKGLPYRDFITVGLLLKKLNLENNTKIKTYNDIVPDCWIYVQEKSVKMGRIQIFNNWSPYMVKDFKNDVWIGLEYFADENDELWKMNEADFIDFATNELISMGIIDKEDVLDAIQLKMKKAYPAYFDTYSRFGKVKEFLLGIDNLHCIGRNGQHRYNNMDHSMLTAIEVAKCILNPDSDKAKVWDVNTEQDYHETK